jgi:hypothetical protein
VYLAGVPDEKLQRSSRMADPQDHPDNVPDTEPEHPPGAGPTPPGAGPTSPADNAPAKPPEHAAEMSTPSAKAPDKPAKKTPAKKAPAKAAKAAKKAQQAAPKKAAAKKAAAKKAPAKKAPAKKAPAKSQPAPPPRIETNGQLAAAAKDAAAHAKSTVDAANNPVSGQVPESSAGRSPVPLAVAIAISLLALLLARQLRRRAS